MVQEKLGNFEMRLKYIIEEHNKECKSEFRSYEQHIKEQVKQMTEYLSEVHSTHIAEIASIKKEKGEQILIN